MTRFKWFRINVPSGVHALSSELRAQPYDDRTGFGFISNSPELSFLMIWKARVPVTAFDSAGTPERSFIETLNACKFQLLEGEDCAWLRVDDPPRSVADLLHRLQRAAGFGFFSEPVVFTSDTHAALLKGVDHCKLVGMKGVAGLRASSAVARIEFASKEGLVPEKIDFLETIDFVADFAAYEVLFRGERSQISFASNGVVKISGILLPMLLKIIEQQLGVTKHRSMNV